MNSNSVDLQYHPHQTIRMVGHTPGVTQWGVALQNIMMTYFEVEPSKRFDTHSHESEQITYVLEGALYFELEGKEIYVGPGDIIAIPSLMPHAVRTQDLFTRAVDAWSPVMVQYKTV
ncbi:MAG: cupin domain-containing protein [Ignavibacteriales bacterium]|nr:cupin domain-containing protein [Ignavibacteriales bacterium]